MLAGVIGELDHQQVPALDAAADAVGSGDLRAAFLRRLQDGVHLSVGVVDKLHGGSRLLSQEHFYAVVVICILFGWKEIEIKTQSRMMRNTRINKLQRC